MEDDVFEKYLNLTLLEDDKPNEQKEPEKPNRHNKPKEPDEPAPAQPAAIVKAKPTFTITAEMRAQIKEDEKRWDEIEGKVKLPEAGPRTYTFSNNNYKPTEEEIAYWKRIFDGDEELDIAEIINRMIFDAVLDHNPQNNTRMMNKLFRAAYNEVLVKPKGCFTHEYEIKEDK